MKIPIAESEVFPQIVTSGRIALGTMAICCLLYTLLILGIGQTVTPYTANGSLIRNEQGVIVGSECLAQPFSRPEYLWPRPSAANYNASETGGSNLSPTNPEIHSRAKALIEKLGVTGEKKIPADLVTASGSGMDPHITLSGARYQAERIASGRGLPVSAVAGVLRKYAKRPGGALTSEPVVNVLLVNVALDRLGR
jgi:K+-transporting ATPase ATPase C chain